VHLKVCEFGISGSGVFKISAEAATPLFSRSGVFKISAEAATPLFSCSGVFKVSAEAPTPLFSRRSNSRSARPSCCSTRTLWPMPGCNGIHSLFVSECTVHSKLVTVPGIEGEWRFFVCAQSVCMALHVNIGLPS